MIEGPGEKARQTTRASTAAAQATAERGVQMAQEAPEASVGGYEKLLALGRDQVEGVAQASAVLLKHTSELNHIWVEFWNAQLSDGVEALRALMACRSWPEAVELQNHFTRASLERACVRAARSAELTAEMINRSLEPLQESARKGVARLSQQVA